MKFKDDDMLDSWKYIIPLGAIVFLIPLIVRLTAVVPTSIEKQIFNKLDIYADFFSYNKGKVLIALACIALMYMLYALVLENVIIKKTLFYIPMAIYLIFVLLSTLTSEQNHISLFGFAERYEGMIIICMYMLILFLAINLTNSKKSLVILLSLLFISASIICIIGLFQYFGYDLFSSYIGKKLILPGKYASQEIDISMGKGTLYSTLMNSNYVGSYLSLTLPLLISLIIYSKNKKLKVVFSLVFLLNFATLIGCNSRAGFLGFITSAVIYIVFRFKSIFKKKNLIVFSLILTSIIGAFMLLNKANNNKFYNSLSSMINQITTPIKHDKVTNINDISLKNNDTVKISLDQGNLYVSLDSKFNFKFMDENNNILQYENNKENNIVLNDDKFKTLNFSLKKYKELPIITLQEGWLEIGFILDNGTMKYFVPATLKIYDIKPVPSIGFKGRESLGSYRGYIWSRTLPMLKNTILVGKGPDTFAIYFPQHDFMSRLNCGWYQNVIVDKPHNFYLGTAFNTGILSLIALLVLFAMYFVKCCKLYFNKEIKDFYNIIGFGIFLSTLGYLVSCIFNDSMVGIAPVFWILLGCGIAINMKLDKKTKIKSELI